MDDAARELQRRFTGTRLVADEAAWLNARLRSGELGPNRCRLAAMLGHRAAGLIMPDVRPDELERLADDLEAPDAGESALERMAAVRRRVAARSSWLLFVGRVFDLDRHCAVRGAAAVVVLRHEVWRRAPREVTQAVQAAHAAVQAWLADPSDGRSAECERLASTIQLPWNDAGLALSAVKHLASAASPRGSPSHAVEAVRWPGVDATQALRTIRQALVPWAVEAHPGV